MTHDSIEWRKVRDQKLREWIGEPNAERFLVQVSTIIELWDDLIDKDKELTDAHIHHAMQIAVVDMNKNPFYREHFDYFQPIFDLCLNSWHDSLELEQGSKSDKANAFVLRNISLQLVPLIIQLLRGREEARKVSTEIWKFFTAHDDVLEYIGEQP